jgi:hypothetical protein
LLTCLRLYQRKVRIKEKTKMKLGEFKKGMKIKEVKNDYKKKRK